MDAWAHEEVAHLPVVDPRRARRLGQILTDLAAHPQRSVPVACGRWSATKATYRCWSRGFVTAAAIRTAHTHATRARIGATPSRLLVLQDTTEVNYTAHPATAGMGPLHRTTTGFLLHSALAVTEAGVPLGLLHQQSWVRDATTLGHSATRRARAQTAKESQRWLTTQAAIEATLGTDVAVLTVADRESDIYAYFARPRPPQYQVLVRVAQNRAVVEEAGYVWTAAHHAPLVGYRRTTLPRHDDQPAREVVLALRVVPVHLQPPRHAKADERHGPVLVWLVLAQEVGPLVHPVTWLLATTEPVTTLEEATTTVHAYELRWLVERYHYVVKQGCQVEALQLRTQAALDAAVATYAIVAWRLLWLTYQARQPEDQPCTIALTTPEWQALYATQHHTTVLPDQPPTVRQAVRWIAHLGGFLGRTHDGEPGLKVLWRGWQRLTDIVATWRLLHPDALDPLVGNA